MTHFVAFLRAVNVGGTGKLPMADLRMICAQIGFADVRTYIASGNVVFQWSGDAVTAQSRLEAALADYTGRPVGVLIRDGKDMVRILADNPFQDAPPAKVVTIFLNDPPPPSTIVDAKGRRGEEIALGQREIYVHYSAGQGSSKLILPVAAQGTARNLNTVSKMAGWLRPETG